MNDAAIPSIDDFSGTDSGDVLDGSRWGWAAYLGASWTWCIGMFLPVLLIHDYGPWAWVIFAVPNVVGAAAMGWVMRSSTMSRHYIADNAVACRLFSLVTIAFQVFFAIWMLPKLIGPVGYVGALILVQSAFTPLTNVRWLQWGGFVALLISALATVGLTIEKTLVWPAPYMMTAGEAVGLSIVCLAGFVTCPYLDLTFHRARIETSNADAKFAFGVGFGVFFASMIVLTFFYATNFLGIGGVAAWLLAIHLLAQMTYTVHVHSAEMNRQAIARDDVAVMRSALGAMLAAGVVIAFVAYFAAEHGVAYRGRTCSEIGYRIFMSTYGLLFPAYVLLAIDRRRVSTFAWLGITLAATPFYWLAFIEGRMVWAIAGVAVLVIGAVAGRAVRPAATVLPSE